tara:strand:+ start:2844 stop:4037 length:1194 start_codon:yes stop_codon:yes gene_type:complete
MNIQLVKSYIEEYKKEFNRVHKQEIYKWHAIKQFQDYFDINASKFYENLELSLNKSDNLLDSRLYFPKRMLLKNAEKSQEQLREMFKILYDEDFNYLERIENFRSEFKNLSKSNFPELKNDYQDHRAIVVYLALKYPERYFFYKFKMFNTFSEKVNYTYHPKGGKIENISQFQNLCELVRYEIEKDQDLLFLHEDRLDRSCYRDRNYNILTQDFIYAVVQHLDKLQLKDTPKSEILAEKDVLANSLFSMIDNPNFTPRFTNHIQNNIENKRIGDLGEIWVLKHEKEFLEKNGKEKLAEKVKHVAKDKGDGLGYDVLSYDLNGNAKYIEVKTTEGNKISTFFVTRNELERSKIEKDNYFLYRVYEYNEITEKGKVLKIKGNLTNICIIPSKYKVNLEK